MIVYHTSPLRIEQPDTLHSRQALDFGVGFYVTLMRQQAISYGKRFHARGLPAVLNVYELADRWREGFRVKTFNAYDGEWLDFVAANRTLQSVESYDAVEGGVANDKIFQTIDLYLAHLISHDEALRQLRFEQPNHQICLRRQCLIDTQLTFLSAETF